MEEINKPGVYVVESLTPNIPIISSTATTAAAFIGFADRGPTTVNSSGKVVGVPTLVDSSGFDALFSFSGSPATFDSSISTTLGTAGNDLKYAANSYFNNNGAEVFVLRDINTDATKASISLEDNNAVLAQAEYWTLDGTESNKIKISASNPGVFPFANKGYEVGRVVALKNMPSPFNVLNEKSWVISDVDPNGNFIKIIYKTGVITANSTLSITAINSTIATTATGTGSLSATTITVATTSVAIGQVVTGTGIQATGATVTAIGTGTITVNPANTGAVSGTLTFYTGAVTYSLADTAGLFAGNSVTVSGASSPGSGGSYNGTFTIASVSASTSFTVNGNFAVGGSTSTATGTILTPRAVSSNAPIVIVGGGQGTNSSLQIFANSHGIWGNYLWASISPNVIQNRFDLNVFYSLTATTSADLLNSSNRVETHPNLSMDPTSTRYALNVINNSSQWITVSDLGVLNPISVAATGTSGQNTLSVSASSITSIVQGMNVTGANVGANAVVISTAGTTVTVSSANTGTVNSTLVFATPSDLHDSPAFTSYWNTSTAATNVNTSNTTGEFVWNTSGVSTGNGSVTVNSVNAVKLGKTYTDVVTYPTTSGSNYPTAFRVVSTASAGTNGTTAPDLTNDTLPRLDAITAPLVFNYPKKYLATDVNKMLTYAATKGNSFVVIDPTNNPADSIATVLSNIGGYTSNNSYGAAYYPYISIKDPASGTNGNTVVPASAAVMAVYLNTDTSRGVYVSPAGTNAIIRNAISATSLTNDDFNLVNNNPINLNIIRPISGNFCIMGARTLKNTASDRFITVRRSLNYLSTTLKNSTEFALFLPNDTQLRSNVTSVVNGILYNFWRQGGLAGQTQGEAYYVKCDSGNNTSASIAAGELRVEVGVALQQPAEFVIITLGQINGGATVTTSV